MRSQWSDEQAERAVQTWAGQPGCNEDLALRVYTSRLIGREPSLVLHGGGNTSVKTVMVDDTGDRVEVLCVKGSGSDLADIEPRGFPALRLGGLRSLRSRDALDDEAMVNAARTRMLDASAPNPSVEVLLHAFLPHKFIDHSHADAVLSLVDQPDAIALCRRVFGSRLIAVPYVMPGFALAKLAAEVYEAHPGCEGLLLLHHGLFTFGDTARESYERHLSAVSEAEAFIAAARRPSTAAPRERVAWTELAPLLRGALGADGRRYVFTLRDDAAAREFADDPELRSLASRGPATPDHVIRTKALPLVLELPADRSTSSTWATSITSQVEAYRRRYREYVAAQLEAKRVQRTPLDPDPRVVIVPGLGVVAVGSNARAAAIVADIYDHTIQVIRGAEAVGTYAALGSGDLFDMEYWSLEQAKLGTQRPARLQGQVVIVTGAASGIGEATARRFAREGAEVAVVDRDETRLLAVARSIGAPAWVIDVGDRQAVLGMVDEVVARFGGLDGIVSNAGIAPESAMRSCPPERLLDSLQVNLLAHQWLASAACEVMRRQGQGGFLSFNASKAAFDPGPGFGPYAVAKAALVALMKQYALEEGSVGIRSNAVNADRVRTGLLPEDFVQRRAAARGIEPDAYFRANLLRREVTVDHVAEAFFQLAIAEATTGAVVPVDGGNIAASPR